MAVVLVDECSAVCDYTSEEDDWEIGADLLIQSSIWDDAHDD